MARLRDRIILWDLDGTLYRSRAAYRFFAHCVAEGLPSEARDAYLARTESYLGGVLPEGLTEFGSDWGAMVRLALPFLDEDEESLGRISQDGFARLRPYLLGGAPDIRPNAVLRRFLKAARRFARLAVVTNGPSLEARPLLSRLGIADLFDAVIAEAGKPEGLIQAQKTVSELDPGVSFRETLSVGDNWRNDLLPALQAGWKTAFVLPLAGGLPPDVRATWQARELEPLLPEIAHWLVKGPDRPVTRWQPVGGLTEEAGIGPAEG